MGKSFMEGLSDFTSNITSSVVTDPEELAELNEIWNAADQNEKIFASVDDNTVGDSTDSLDNLISDKGFLKEIKDASTRKPKSLSLLKQNRLILKNLKKVLQSLQNLHLQKCYPDQDRQVLDYPVPLDLRINP